MSLLRSPDPSRHLPTFNSVPALLRNTASPPVHPDPSITMAARLPQPFQTIDIIRFTQKAQELEKFKPVISYWCMRSPRPVADR